ncbi:MAG: hypothetical protein M0038_02990 [Pseudomonadota bacterium]|jgi:hypothetical protein|nr:hypothetical protein [Pseudomonadota bacterium]
MNTIRKLLAAIPALLATAITAGVIFVSFPAATSRLLATAPMALLTPPALSAAGRVARK